MGKLANLLRKSFAVSVTKTTDAIAFLARPFVSEEKLLEYKPIHLCWWFRKHGYEIPTYFIAGHTFYDPSQIAYRFRNDDGSQTTATWKAAQNTQWSPSITGNTTFRLRFEIQENSGGSGSFSGTLQYNINNVAWANVGTSTNGIFFTSSATVSDGTATTNQLTAGSGTFAASQFRSTATAATASVPANGHTEVEYCLALHYGFLNSGDTVTFRIVDGGGTMAYTQTPQVNVTKVFNAPPTISPNTTDATAFGETTPVLEATATDPTGNDVQYGLTVSTTSNMQGGESLNFSSTTVTNGYALRSGGSSRVGQTFTTSSAGPIRRVRFFLWKSGSPTIRLCSKIYATSGGLPTGSALDTSYTSIASSSLNTTLGGGQWIDFYFFGDVSLSNSTLYAVTCEVILGSGTDDASNFAVITGSSGSVVAGNYVAYAGGGWGQDTNIDIGCYIYTGAPAYVSRSTGSGWANTVSGGDTNPFNSGQKVSHTFQSTLGGGTYYYQFSATDPNGGGTWADSPTSVRSFSVTDPGPINLVQYAHDGITPLAVGGTVSPGETPTLSFDLMPVVDAETTTLNPSTEVDPTSTAFSGTASEQYGTSNPLVWNPDIWKGMRGAGIVWNPNLQGFVVTHGSYDTAYRTEAWLLLYRRGNWQWQPMTVRDSGGSVVTNYNGTQAPEQRYYFSLTWDSWQGHAIFFGGFSGSDNNDTWRLWFSDANDTEPEWWEVSPSGSIPAARSNIGQSTCYDPDGAKTWLFGGWGASYYNDVYVYDSSTFNGTWTQLHSGAGTAPPVTRNGSLIFDEANNRLIQFGGHNGTTSRNTTWSFNLSNNTWTELTGLGTAPAARELHNAVYDATNQRMLVWGGNSNSSSGTYYRDMWELDLTSGSEAWNQISDATDSMPLSTYGAFSDVAPEHDVWYIGGGVDSTADPERREFAIDLTDTGDPIDFKGLAWNNYYRPLDAGAYAFNPDHNEFMVTHGYQHIPDNSTILDGGHGTATWIYDAVNNHWRSPIVDGFAPFQREGALLVYDTIRDRFIMFGGYQGDGVGLNDTWECVRNSNGDYKWNRLRPTGTLPTRRWLMAGGFDATNNRMVIWGGSQGSGGPNNSDTWELSFASSADGAWTQRTPSGTAPTAKWGASYAVDTTNNRLHIAGGATSTGDTTYTGEHHYLDMSTTTMAWTSRASITNPKRSATMSYDPTNGRLHLFGGYDGAVNNDSQYYNISANTWTTDTAISGAPTARRSHHAFFYNGKHYITAGRPNTGTWFNDTYALTPNYTTIASSTWANQSPDIYKRAALKPSTLSANTYHWQAWAGASTKVSFGGNAESATDFQVASPNSPPTVALSTPADTGTVGITPTFEFTGTDPEGDPVTYQIQIDHSPDFNNALGSWHDFGFSNSWLADDLSSTPVSSWVNGQGGTALTQGTGVNQPAYSATSGPNSQPGVTFDGINDSLQAAIGTKSQPQTYIVIFQNISNGSFEWIFDSMSASNRNAFGQNSSSQWEIYAGTVQVAGTVDTNAHAAIVYIDGASSELFLNDIQTIAANAGAQTLETGITVGARYDEAAGWANTVISAIGVYNGDARTDNNWSRLCAYVKSKWNLDLDASAVGTSPLLDAQSDVHSGFTNTTNGADTDPFNSGDLADYTVGA